jgi:hypothetical protein
MLWMTGSDSVSGQVNRISLWFAGDQGLGGPSTGVRHTKSRCEVNPVERHFVAARGQREGQSAPLKTLAPLAPY